MNQLCKIGTIERAEGALGWRGSPCYGAIMLLDMAEAALRSASDLGKGALIALVAIVALACGGSASETPPPLPPDTADYLEATPKHREADPDHFDQQKKRRSKDSMSQE